MTDDEPEIGVLTEEVAADVQRAKQAKSLFEQANSSPGSTTQELEVLRDAAIELYNSLLVFREDSEVQDIWTDWDLNTFGQLLEEREEVVVKPNEGLRQPPETTTQLRVAGLSGDQLKRVIEGLVLVAKEKGYAPEETDRAPKEIGTIDDVKWLLRGRNQEKAIAELEPPENDPDAVTDGGVVTADPDVGPDVTSADTADRYPFRGPFFQMIAKRKRQGKDAKIAVSSANAETGVGKSTCAYYLAHVLDTSPRGYIVEDKATLDVGSFLQAYDELSKGSALILDEAEQLTGRRSMSKKNVKAGERWQMRRVAEICSLLTLPKFSVLDPLMKDLVDFRVEVRERGRAEIFAKSHHPFGDTWWDSIQIFEYPNMDGTAGMERLHELKEEFNDETEQAIVSQDEAQAEASKSAQEAQRDLRDASINSWDEEGVAHTEIRRRLEDWVEDGKLDEDLLVSRQRIQQIASEPKS